MHNIMLDIETLGNKPNAALVAIGAVMFEPSTGELGAEFQAVISLDDAMKYGVADASTLKWWLKQSDDARHVFNDKNAVSTKDALLDFQDFLIPHCPWKSRTIWGNGATFDPVILGNAYETTQISVPWPFWGTRDVRTIVDIGRALFDFDPKKDMPFEGTPHSALDDAKHQAKYVSAIYQKINTAAALSKEAV